MHLRLLIRHPEDGSRIPKILLLWALMYNIPSSKGEFKDFPLRKVGYHQPKFAREHKEIHEIPKSHKKTYEKVKFAHCTKTTAIYPPMGMSKHGVVFSMAMLLTMSTLYICRLCLFYVNFVCVMLQMVI